LKMSGNAFLVVWRPARQAGRMPADIYAG